MLGRFRWHLDVGGVCFFGQTVVPGSGCGPLMSKSIPGLKSLVYMLQIICIHAVPALLLLLGNMGLVLLRIRWW